MGSSVVILGMRKQIEEITDDDDDSMLEELLSNTILSHAENPSNIIADVKNYDHPLLCLLGESRLKSLAKTVGITKGKELADSAIRLCDALSDLASLKKDDSLASNTTDNEDDAS